MKQRYQNLKSQEMSKKVSGSSYLTPESASYLNSLIKNNESQADPELVYAGLHEDLDLNKKFKRKEKNKQRFKNRTKKRKKRNWGLIR